MVEDDEMVLAYFVAGASYTGEVVTHIRHWCSLSRPEIERALKRLIASGLLEERRGKKQRGPMGDFAERRLRRLLPLEVLARQKRSQDGERS